MIRSASPIIWRGYDLRVELGLFLGDGATATPMDVSTLSSITVAVAKS